MGCLRRSRHLLGLAAALGALLLPAAAAAAPAQTPRPPALVSGKPNVAKPSSGAKSSAGARTLAVPKPPLAAPLPTPSPLRAARMPTDVPLPVPRPRDPDAPAEFAAPPSPTAPPSPSAPPSPAEAEPLPGMDDAALAACLADFAAGGGAVLPRPSEDPPANPACAIPGPVTFAQVRLEEGAVVKLEAAVTVRCTLARELAGWIRDDLAPIAKRHGGALAQLSGVGGHACRTRNGQPGAQISEHASGNAFDLLALKFADGRVVELWRDDADTREIRAEVKKSACDRFHTVLGPGADSAHANHVHLDLRERRNGFRMCQWDVK